ncbi:MAG: helix-turn-helix domain-containing protein [Aquisalimonadaceae bacterium]
MTSIDPASIPTDPAIRREWIKYQLAIRGYTLAALAREHGVTRQQPQAALTRPYPKWERIIARVLDLSPTQIWPERYPSRPPEPSRK